MSRIENGFFIPKNIFWLISMYKSESPGFNLQLNQLYPADLLICDVWEDGIGIPLVAGTGRGAAAADKDPPCPESPGPGCQ